MSNSSQMLLIPRCAVVGCRTDVLAGEKAKATLAVVARSVELPVLSE